MDAACRIGLSGVMILLCGARVAVAQVDSDPRSLVDRLVSLNSEPAYARAEHGGYEVTYPKDFDREKEKLVLVAWTSLIEIGTRAFPVLIDHLGDQRYSYTSVGNSPPTYTVGRVCREILITQVCVHNAILGREPGRDGYFPTNEKIREWWNTNRRRTLREMQLEAARWALTHECNREQLSIYSIGSREQRVAAMERLVKRLEGSDHSLRVDWKGQFLDDNDKKTLAVKRAD